MTPGDLQERILRWEDPHTDFKESTDSNSELAKDLVCVAKSDGGQLVIGVAKGTQRGWRPRYRSAALEGR